MALPKVLHHFFIANPQICEEVAEFLEADLLPYLMLDSDNRADNGLRLIQFVIATAKSLEVRQKENYPENAVRFAQCIRRTFEHVDKQAISPTEQVCPLPFSRLTCEGFRVFWLLPCLP